MSETIYERIEAYIGVVKSIHEAYYTRDLENLTPPPMSWSRGKRYAKIIEDIGSQRSVHSFVDLNSGAILKPAGWNAPAKHARGNVWDDDNGASALTPHGGVTYLR